MKTEVVDFTTKEEMTEIFSIAKNRGVKVLIPYYAGGEFVEPTSTAPLAMSNAHWAMRTDKGLSEGWRDSSAKAANDDDTIFASNQFIGDTYTEKGIDVSDDETVKVSTLKGRAILVGITTAVNDVIAEINGT
ncbi:MAG: hypothetical protein LBI19_09680 [Oscillospiraceae bacterium]|nr:hypothetical protein [Oscillospiraceae bacterium]